MHVFLGTEGLLLRRFGEADVDRLSALHNDPKVMRFLNGGKPAPREEVEHEYREHFARHGYWAAVEKATGEFVGWFALHPQQRGGPEGHEFGYRLKRSAWGKGYATEGSRALIEEAFAALKAGARGYVLKDADRGTLLRAIRAVSRGEVLLSAPVARRVLEQFSETQPPPDPPRETPLFEDLTPRETEVLGLIAAGLKNREISARLYVSEKTVGNHVSNVFRKLRVTDRVQAIIRAREAGMGGERKG